MTLRERFMTADRHPPDHAARRSLRRIAMVVVLSIVLGLAMQGLILGLTLWDGGEMARALASAAGGITWSVLVCAGVGVGTVLARGRALLSGALSMAVAPASLAVAKASQKTMSGWLGAAPTEALISLGTMSLLRGIEYGLLGWLLGRLVAGGRRRPWPYLGVGVLAGTAFGGTITYLTWRAALLAGTPLTEPRIASTVINEMVFPVGCAVVIFLGHEVGRSLSLIADEAGDRQLPA